MKTFFCGCRVSWGSTYMGGSLKHAFTVYFVGDPIFRGELGADMYPHSEISLFSEKYG